MALGGWAVLNTDTSASFDILDHIKNLNFDDKDMFKLVKFMIKNIV